MTFNHTLSLTDVPERGLWFLSMIDGRKVLHVGCSDHPIFNPDANLHLYLERLGNAAQLDGCDPELPDTFRNACGGQLYRDLREVPPDYDLVLLPEVLEHVCAPAELLELALTVGREVVVTVPCWMGYCATWQQQAQAGAVSVDEFVHEDHVAWYSPRTLRTLIEKVGGVELREMYWINGGNSVGARLSWV